MTRPLVAHIVGARPNYMKTAPVYAALQRRGRVRQRLIHTGQHYDASVRDVFFEELPLPEPHVQLRIGSGGHGEQTGARLDAYEINVPEGVFLAPPQPYGAFLSLECGASAVVTDSGGVQEETTALGIPCFTLRDNTERPVTVTHGTNVVLGLSPARLAEVADRLVHPRRSLVPPLWDGAAGERAADAIESYVAGAGRALPRHVAAIG